MKTILFFSHDEEKHLIIETEEKQKFLTNNDDLLLNKSLKISISYPHEYGLIEIDKNKWNNIVFTLCANESLITAPDERRDNHNGK